jgi:hypothetical protein
MVKKFNPYRKTANQGVAFVQKIVDEMDCVWRPTPNDDVGLDGEIELGKDGAATARLIKVQVKSGKSYFHKETATRFEFIAKPDDLEYWSRVNLPVILVVYDPEKGEGYWKHIQRFLSDNPGSITKARHIPFSKRKDRLVVGTFVQLCNLVFDDEAELTNFLKNKVKEPIYSNLLAVVEYPETLYHFQLSESRLAELFAEPAVAVFPKDIVPHGNGYIAFRDPRQIGSKVASAVIANTVETESSLQYLQNPNTRNKIVGIWNYSLTNYLLTLELLQKDMNRFYFPPEKGGKPREVQWTSPHRTPTRTVAYPYTGKQSQKVMFWVHHSIWANFRNVGGDWFLKMEPGYVFTRDGKSFIQSSDAGALSTSRMSQERNYQVINHLYFWAWYLKHGETEICIPCGSQHLVVDPELAHGVANFGIGTDKKTLSTILSADYDVNWGDLEDDTTAGKSQSGDEE